MKIKNFKKNFLWIFFGMGICLTFFSCNNTIPPNQMKITGVIQEQGITSYQYGTHTIVTENGEFYALTSEMVDLDDFIGKEVNLTAEKIEGYPVDGGPVYLKVLTVEEN